MNNNPKLPHIKKKEVDKMKLDMEIKIQQLSTEIEQYKQEKEKLQQNLNTEIEARKHEQESKKR